VTAEPQIGGDRRVDVRACLTPRELEVLQMLSKGSTNSEIAGELSLTVHAVKFHLASVYRKLGVANRTEAAVAFLLSPTVAAETPSEEPT
jgi:DNA-binding NarL/FixJ family response regulator